MNDQTLKETLKMIGDTIETLGNEIADLIASGDSIRALEEDPGSANRAGAIRYEVRAVREQINRTIGRIDLDPSDE